MARKLSQIARRITFTLVAAATSISSNLSPAQSEPQTAQPPAIIEHPFSSAQAQPQPKVPPRSSKSQTVPEPQQKANRHAIAYQNPFAAASKSPPVDTSLRPG